MTRDRVILGLSILIALLLWLPQKLTKSYRHNIALKISATPADNRQLVQDAVKLFPIEISGRGSKLYKLSSDIKRDTINLSYLGENLRKTFSAGEIIAEVRDVYAIAEEISIRPDLTSLTFQFDSIMTKVIPVVSQIDPTLAAGYGMINEISIVPDEISITGPYDALQSISSIPTESIELADLKMKTTREVVLQVPVKSSGIRTSHGSVVAVIDVDQLVEKELIVPFDTFIEGGKSWKLFPDQILVTVSVPLRMLNDVRPADIQLKTTVQGDQAVSVDVDQVPQNIKYINHSPKILRYFEQPTDTLR